MRGNGKIIPIVLLALIGFTLATIDKSNAVKNATFAIPITFIGFILGNGNANLINTGHSAEVHLATPVTTQIVFGGPFGFNLYVYNRTIFYWTNELKKTAYKTVAGENSAPLAVSIMFCNFKYGSCENSQNHPDGVAEIVFQIRIGSVYNPLFGGFAKAMEEIKNPGSSVEIKLIEELTWYQFFPFNLSYVAYATAIPDESNGKLRYCATTAVVQPNEWQTISKKQFEGTFLQLTGSKRKPLTNQKRKIFRGKGQISKSSGVLELPVPFAIPFLSIN